MKGLDWKGKGRELNGLGWNECIEGYIDCLRDHSVRLFASIHKFRDLGRNLVIRIIYTKLVWITKLTIVLD